MEKVIEWLLIENKDNYNYKIRIIKELLIFTGKQNKFIITDQNIFKIIEIISKFKLYEKADILYESFIENLTRFFCKIVWHYEEGKFDKYNFILDEEKGINNALKEWLKKNKTAIYDMCNYYFQAKNQNEKQELLYFSDYLEVIKLYKNRSQKWEIPKYNNDNLEIRLVLKGEIYYKNGILLKEKEYIISSPTTQLDKYKILTENLVLLIIKLKKNFLKKIKVKELSEIKHQILTIDKENFKKINNNTMFKNYFTFFLDVIIILLEVNKLVETDIIVSLIIEREKEIQKIIKIIDKNIMLPEEKIKDMIVKKLQIRDKIIDEIIYKGTKLTLKKFILKEKIKYILDEYINSNNIIELEKLLIKYNYSNIKNFRYNIKNFYNISIKDIKK